MNLKDLGTATLEDLKLADMLLENMVAARDNLLAMLDASEKDAVLTVLRELADYMMRFQNQKDLLAAAKAIYKIVESIPKWQLELLPEIGSGSQMGISTDLDNVIRDNVINDPQLIGHIEEYRHGIPNKIHTFVGERSQAITTTDQSDVGQTKLQQIINHFFSRS